MTTFTEWMAQVEALFTERLEMSATRTGWVWQAIFEEGLSPEQAVADYMGTL